MTSQDRNQLLAEKASLERMIANLPESSVIDRMSLEARKAAVEEALAAAPVPAHEPARVRLRFRGRPVVGSHGIFAEFGSKAVKAFVDAVAAIGASQDAALGARGAIPNREQFQLLITGTALGSFGFELEESPNLLPDDYSQVYHAIAQTRRIMEASLGSDDELTEAIVDADPRAIEALRGFLQTLVENEAVCDLELKDDVFRFKDVNQVRRSVARLQQDNIHEEDDHLSVSFSASCRIAAVSSSKSLSHRKSSSVKSGRALRMPVASITFLVRILLSKSISSAWEKGDQPIRSLIMNDRNRL